MQNGSSGRPTGVCTGDATEGRPELSEPEGGTARVARERPLGARTNALAAAIAEIKELYERECAGDGVRRSAGTRPRLATAADG